MLLLSTFNKNFNTILFSGLFNKPYSLVTIERKALSLIAPIFIVFALGKVIVFNKYIIIYSKPAITIAISLKSYLLIITLSNSRRIIKLNFRDISLNYI